MHCQTGLEFLIFGYSVYMSPIGVHAIFFALISWDRVHFRPAWHLLYLIKTHPRMNTTHLKYFLKPSNRSTWRSTDLIYRCMRPFCIYLAYTGAAKVVSCTKWSTREKFSIVFWEIYGPFCAICGEFMTYNICHGFKRDIDSVNAE